MPTSPNYRPIRCILIKITLSTKKLIEAIPSFIPFVNP